MDLPQTYETTIYDETGECGVTVLTIPARSFARRPPSEHSVEETARDFLGLSVEPLGDVLYVGPEMILRILPAEIKRLGEKDAHFFATYVANARIIPFEQSPLGAESLANIALKSSRAGSIGIGATVGFIAAGPTPFLLIAVPLGIVLCGAAVSFAKWLEENRKPIWSRLLQRGNPKPARPIRKFELE